jgi:CO/xanthine dehydrogenase Mo-binding subunit
MDAFLQPVLADGEVRYVGEPVAVVIADGPYIAEDARELVEIDVEPATPFLGGPEAGDQTICDNLIWETAGTLGDIDAAFARADVVVEAQLAVGRQTGLPMETRSLVAEWRDGGLHLWGATKFLRFTRSTLAALFSVPEAAVHLHRVDVGGMFGPRGEFYPEDFLVPWAARIVGHPVKWIEDRQEHLMAVNHSREQVHRCAVAVAADGTLLGLRDDAVVDLGAYARPIGARMVDLAAQTLPGPYRWKAYALRARGIITNKTPVGTMRGPGSFETTFVRERMLDMAAARLGMDPLELRRRNLLTARELPGEQAMGERLDAVHLDSGDYHETLGELLELARHEELTGEVRRRRADGETVGLGVACFVEHSGLGGQEAVDLSVDADGCILLRTSTTEVGQGLAGMAASVVGEALGVTPDRVRVETADAARESLGSGTFSSRSTIFVGSAAHDASRQLLGLVRARAAEALACDPADVTIADDGCAANGRRLAWRDLAGLQVTGRHVMKYPTYGFGAIVALVSIDADTGAIKPERLAVGFDAGRVIDRPGACAQLAGAALMGIGGALYEELGYTADGDPISVTFMDYIVPTSAERPSIDAFALETRPAPCNPLGVRGVGEAGLVGVGAAVANAVAAAVQRAQDPVLTTLPLKPHAVADLLPLEWPAGEEIVAPKSTRSLLRGGRGRAGAGACALVAGALAFSAWRARRNTT